MPTTPQLLFPMPPLAFASLPFVEVIEAVGNEVAIGPGIVPETDKELGDGGIVDASDGTGNRATGTVDVGSTLAEAGFVSLLAFVDVCLLSSPVELRSELGLSPLGVVVLASSVLLSLRKPNGLRSFAFALCDGALCGT